MNYISTKMKKQIPGICWISQTQHEPDPNPNAAVPQAFLDGGGFYTGGRPSSQCGAFGTSLSSQAARSRVAQVPPSSIFRTGKDERIGSGPSTGEGCASDVRKARGQGAAFRAGLREKSQPSSRLAERSGHRQDGTAWAGFKNHSAR